MSDRGRYRSITCALVNGPDYQQLTPEARLVLLTLKISFGPTGIELRYPDGKAWSGEGDFTYVRKARMLGATRS